MHGLNVEFDSFSSQAANSTYRLKEVMNILGYLGYTDVVFSHLTDLWEGDRFSPHSFIESISATTNVIITK